MDRDPNGRGKMMPDFLQALPRWVLWRNGMSKSGKSTKLPIAYKGYQASSAKPDDWTTYAQIVAAIARTPGAFDGPGVVLGDLGNGEVLSGLDLDTCLEDGAIAEWARPFIRILRTYGEISPSGNGLKLFFRVRASDMPQIRRLFSISDDEHGRKKTYGISAGGHPPAAEIYLSHRYFTVTGEQWSECPDDVAIVSDDALTALSGLFGARERQGDRAGVEDTTAPETGVLRRKDRPGDG